MFKKNQPEPLMSIIAKGTTVSNIETDSDVLVSGRVKGDVSGNNITVYGEVDGNIYSVGKVILTKHSKVKGTLQCISVEIEEGTIFSNFLNVGVTGSAEEKASQAYERDEK